MNNRQLQDAYVVAATRTPIAKRNGTFIHTRPDDMLAHVLRSVMARVPDVPTCEVADVIVGCAMPEAEQGMNVARLGLLLAGFPVSVPGITVNRFCASGLNAIAMAAAQIQTGEADVVIGAGTESMSVMPEITGNKTAINPAFFTDNEHIALAYGMGLTAEKVAALHHVSREDQDAFAQNSHLKALAAIRAGLFKAEITPYPVREYLPDLDAGKVEQREHLFDTDEGPREDSSLEALAKLRPVFAAKGSVTAGNSSQMSDGAAAVLLMSEAGLKRYNVQPIARFCSFAVEGVPPEVMGIGPIAAVPKALFRAGLSQSLLGHIELNEAFAAQALAVIRLLGLDPSLVNPQGGAIALGHPLGATGAIRTATLMAAMQRDQRLKYGMVTMCVGSGMGAAGVFERSC